MFNKPSAILSIILYRIVLCLSMSNSTCMQAEVWKPGDVTLPDRHPLLTWSPCEETLHSAVLPISSAWREWRKWLLLTVIWLGQGAWAVFCRHTPADKGHNYVRSTCRRNITTTDCWHTRHTIDIPWWIFMSIWDSSEWLANKIHRKRHLIEHISSTIALKLWILCVITTGMPNTDCRCSPHYTCSSMDTQIAEAKYIVCTQVISLTISHKSNHRKITAHTYDITGQQKLVGTGRKQ